MGMLETAPGRGTFVRSATPTSSLLDEFLADYTLEEILSYRRALEVEAAQQAALNRSEEDIKALERATREEIGCSRCPVLQLADSGAGAFDSRFHRLVFDAAKNRLLSALYAGINDQLRTPAHRGRLANVATSAEMERDHHRVLDAIKRRDFIDAVHAMVDHVDHDVVIVNDQQEAVPSLQRTPEQQQRIDDVRESRPSGV